MALNEYMGICNHILRKFNEVEFTSSSFAGASDFHGYVKDIVNVSIADIYTAQQCQWPFAWNEYTLNATVGDDTYTPDAGITVLDWDSFRLETDEPDGIESVYLPYMNYETYRARILPTRNNSITSTTYDTPRLITRKANNDIILYPIPDQSYTITYEGHGMPTALSAYNDTTDIPEGFIQVLYDRIEHYVHTFRENDQSAAMANARYQEGLGAMTRMLIPFWDTVVPR